MDEWMEGWVDEWMEGWMDHDGACSGGLRGLERKCRWEITTASLSAG